MADQTSIPQWKLSFLRSLSMYVKTKKAVESNDWDDKITSLWQDKSTGCNLNKYVEVYEPCSLEKRNETVQSISSFFMADRTCLRRSLFDVLHHWRALSFKATSLLWFDNICMLKKNVTKKDVVNDDWEKRKESVQHVSSLVMPYHQVKVSDYYMMQNEDFKDFLMLQKYGTKKGVENDDCGSKMTSLLQDKSTGCNLNKYEESFSKDKRKELLQRFWKLTSKDGFDGKDKKYEHSDEAGSKQMHCIGKNMTNKPLFDANDLSRELGFVYPQKGEVNDANDNWDGKKTSQLQDKSTGCNLNKYEEPFSHDKRKETVQRVISCLIATIVILWFMFYTCTQSSIMQLQPLHKEHGPIFIWSSLVEPFCFMVLVWAIATSIVVGSSSSRMQSAMLMFWAILILVKSAKSVTEVYVTILGILFTGCYMFVEKQP